MCRQAYLYSWDHTSYSPLGTCSCDTLVENAKYVEIGAPCVDCPPDGPFLDPRLVLASIVPQIPHNYYPYHIFKPRPSVHEYLFNNFRITRVGIVGLGLWGPNENMYIHGPPAPLAVIDVSKQLRVLNAYYVRTDHVAWDKLYFPQPVYQASNLQCVHGNSMFSRSSCCCEREKELEGSGVEARMIS